MFNEGKDGVSFLKSLMDFLIKSVKEKLNLECSKSEIVVLDSTTQEKFSIHLIFPNIIFQDNKHVLQFISEITNEKEYHEKFLVSNKDRKMVSFIDKAGIHFNSNIMILDKGTKKTFL